MIALAADCPGEGTKDVIAAPQAVQDVPEIEARLPREFLSSAIIDIDTIDTREHSPTALTVHLLVVGEQAANYCRGISAEPQEVLRLKRTRGAHDVSPETFYRWHLLSCQNVRVNCVGKVESSIQVLVYLQIEIVVLSAGFRVIVRFRKESAGPQDDAWQAARSGK